MTTTTIAEALAAIGIELTEHETVAICFGHPEGREDGTPRMETRRLAEVADQPVRDNTYFSTGAFDHDTDFSRAGARSAANVRRVLELPFDFDLADYLACAKWEVLALDNAEARSHAEAIWTDVAPIFADLGLAPYRVDYTGNGIAVFVRVDYHQRADVDAVRRAHAALVTRFNNLARMQLADPQVKDAGSRIMRLPYGKNVKVDSETGTIARREPATLHVFADAPRYGVDALTAIAGTPAKPRQRRELPRDGDVPVDGDVLGEIVRAVRPAWTSGSRHAIALGLSAMMAKAGVPEGQAEYVIGELALDDEERHDRLTALRTTYTRYRQGLDVEGYYALRTALDADTLAYVDERLQRIWQAQQAQRTVLSVDFGTPKRLSDGAPSALDPRDYPEPPPAVEYGALGRYVDLVEPTTEAPRAFHLMCGMALVGAMIGRRVGIRYAGDVKYPALYIMLVGPTGDAKKGTTIRRAFESVPRAARDGFDVAGLPYERHYDVGSGPALVEMLAEAPGGNVVLTIEEARNTFDTMRRQNETLRARLLEAWDTPALMRHSVRANPIEATNPFLTLVGAIQPDVLDGTITTSDVSSGLLNRMLFVYGISHEDRYNPPSVDAPLARAWWSDITQAVTHYADGTVLALSPAADRLGERWYREHKAEMRQFSDPTERELRERQAEYIHRFALIFAVTDMAERVEQVHLQAAIDMMNWLWSGVSRHFRMWGSRDYYRIVDKLMRALDDAPRGILPRKVWRDRAKDSRRYDGSEVTRVIRDLADNGDVVIDERGLVCRAEVAQRLIERYGSLAGAMAAPADEVARVIA